jgi:hypothetical protein
MTAPQLYAADAVYCIGFWNNIALVDAVGEIDAPRMRQLGEAYKQLLTHYRHMAVLCVLRPGAPMSSRESRAASQHLLSNFGDALARVAFVVEEGGVFAKMFGTVIRGYNVITRSAKLTVDTDLDEAIHALAPLIVSNIPRDRVAAELKAALASLHMQWKSQTIAAAISRG